MQFCEVYNKAELLRKRVLLHTLAYSNSVKRKVIEQYKATQDDVGGYMYGKNARIRDGLTAGMRY